jgi:hypothetical protein
VLDEVGNDIEVDVSFEQGYADFTQGFGDVLFSERALAAEGFESALEFVCEVFKHSLFQCIGKAGNKGPRERRNDKARNREHKDTLVGC